MLCCGWPVRAGGRWRDLPERFGRFDSVKRRYYLWVEAGVLEDVFKALRTHADQEWLMMDATIVRAHAQAAGARHKKGERGYKPTGGQGLTTKIHGLTDAMGLPLRLIATGGHCSEMTQAAALLAGFKADHVLADKGYDGRCVIDAVNESGAMPVIPSRKNARKPRQTDMALYKERNIVERFFGYLKQFRRVATRYDKHIQNYMGFVYIAAIKIWLK